MKHMSSIASVHFNVRDKLSETNGNQWKPMETNGNQYPRMKYFVSLNCFLAINHNSYHFHAERKRP